MDNALIIFIKNPIKGKVKTRIARTTGDEQALSIYLELSKIIRHNVLLLQNVGFVGLQNHGLLRGISVYVFYSDFIEMNDEWSVPGFMKQLQTGDDLGERMYNAFDFVLKIHPRACIIGSDCPTLSAEIMQQAFEQLISSDCVVGPSTDGGYYLLGIKNNEPTEPNSDGTPRSQSFLYLFENMIWSTDQVLSNTLKRIEKNHLTVFLLPELTDIDEEKDWLIFQKNRQGK